MTIFSNGGPPITADNANQWLTTYDNLAQLRGQIGTVTSAGTAQIASLKGFISPGDGGQGDFWWNANSTAADDAGISAVVPSGSSRGAWIRLSANTFTLSGAEVKTLLAAGTYYLGPQGGQTTNAFGWIVPSAGVATGGFISSMLILVQAGAPAVATFTLYINGAATNIQGSINTSAGATVVAEPFLQSFPGSANVYILAVVTSGTLLCTYTVTGFLAI